MQCNQDPNLIFNKSNVWDVLKQHESVNDIEEFILGFIDVVISNINYRYNQKSFNLVNDIKKYISEHPVTSLTDIAGHFFHSPNYLSTLFSKETGMTIRNYMIEERMNYAKKLLTETNESIGSIATKVGYKTTQHFCTIFNKHTGVTPGVYRSTANGDE